jgi:multiple sugar transport system substrate-binding protein
MTIPVRKAYSSSRRGIGRTSLVILIVVIIIIAGGGSYAYYASHTAVAAKPVTLTIMVDSGSETQQYLSIVANDFHALHPNVIINIEPVGFSDMVTQALTTLKNKASQPAIIMYYPSQAPDEAPYLMNLEQFMNGSDPIINGSNLITSEMQAGGYYYAANGSVISIVGVPIHSVFGYVLGYQKSIFENSTLAQQFQSEYGFPFSPQNLTSWTQLYDLASFINQTHAAEYALLIPDSPHHAIIDMAAPLIAYYEQQDHTPGYTPAPPGFYSYFAYINGQWTTTFNSSAGVQALQIWKKLVQFEPSPTVQPIGYDQQEHFPLTGDYAMFIAWTSFIPIYENSSVSKIAGNLGIALLPGQTTGLAPTFLGINPYGPDPKVAAQFIAFALSDQEYEKGIEQLGYVPGTYTGIAEATHNPNLSWLSPFLTFLKTAEIPPRLAAVVPRISTFSATLIPEFNQQVYNYLIGQNTDAMAVLNTAAREWMTYIEQQQVVL